MIHSEDKIIKVGGVVLPGLRKKVEVTTTAAVDSIEIEGSPVSPKQAVGYEDSRVKIELILDETANETLQSKITRLQTLFRKKGQEIPQPLSIVCKATAAAKIDKVIFEQLTIVEDNKGDIATATLEFCEYSPLPIKAAKSGAASVSAALTQEYQNYLGNSRGSSPLDKSPAIDDRSVDPMILGLIDTYRDTMQ